MERYRVSLTLSDLRNLQCAVHNEIERIVSLLDGLDESYIDEFLSYYPTRLAELRNLLSTLYRVEDGGGIK